MSWFPNDLVSDVDLQTYEGAILTQFQKTDWQDKRGKALEDWIGPILRTQGYDIERLRTRYECDQVWGYTGSAYTDKTSAAKDTSTDDLNLATIFTTAATDALYIGSTKTFRGLSIRLLDAVSAVSAVLTVSYWADGWVNLAIKDDTSKVTGKAFSAGGAVSWRVPSGWVKRAISTSGSFYFVKVTISATPTGAKASQVGVIRRSALCAPATFRTLELIMREAPTGGSGPWSEKADYYKDEASQALQRALQIVGGEFETDDPPTDVLSPDEADQTVEEAGGGWRMERA